VYSHLLTDSFRGTHRRRFRIAGIVQGVGFRPFVARLAHQEGLAGFVQNTTSAVVVEVEGTLAALASFAGRLERDIPPAATVEHVDVEDIEPKHEQQFSIVPSRASGESSVGLPPDLAMCVDCRKELMDPADRRYRYPFLNCTACGPRYSIVEALPYDRPRTSMRGFPMCVECRREYEDPADRRYHAQPIACPVCGPQLSFAPGGERGELALQKALKELRRGQVGAVRGIGGFHLACNARDAGAVALLRTRKARGDQPFALMVRDLETARQFVQADEQAAMLLRSSYAPIVLLPKSSTAGDILAPGNGYAGVMLPYSPLHHLLLNSDPTLDALVMTSGNRHGEPIVTGSDEAREDLRGLADFFLLHNRDIVAPCDDSVVRLYRGRALAIRRGRGYAPLALRLPVDGTASLAMGGDLKAALGIGEGRRVYISPHIGDMETVGTLESFGRTFAHLSTLYRIQPRRVLHDRHRGYLSTQWAQRFAGEHGLPALAIQHHKAHAAAVMAEYGVPPETSILAAVFDGTGYGDDGAIWGGEFFQGTIGRLERPVHLPYIALPGGDASAKRPALSALAHLWAARIDCNGTAPWESLTASERKLAAQQLNRNVNCHATSSMGRLFDAAASLLGIRHTVTFEAQAAIEMEALAARHPLRERYDAGAWNLADLWKELLSDGNGSVEARSRRFTGTIARWTWETLQSLAEATGFATVVLGGGVFQNVLLLDELTTVLEADGFRVLVPRYLPPNDGGIALGQLYLGAVQDRVTL
jgi:hydrogenase maturation protein HypF